MSLRVPSIPFRVPVVSCAGPILANGHAGFKVLIPSEIAALKDRASNA